VSHYLYCRTCGCGFDPPHDPVERSSAETLTRAWRARARLAALWRAVYSEGDLPQGIIGRGLLYDEVEPLEFFAMHTDHDVVLRDPDTNEESAIDPRPEPSPNTEPIEAPKLVTTEQAVTTSLMRLCERAATGRAQGIIVTIEMGPGAYELKWAGWHDPIACAAAMEMAKLGVLGQRVPQDKVGGQQAGESHAGGADVRELNPSAMEPNVSAVRTLLYTLHSRAVAGEIKGFVAAMNVGGNYALTWAGWQDTMLLVGAIEVAKFLLLRSRMS
jgi:hypothetical protein